MTSITKMSDRSVLTSCRLGFFVDSGTALSAASLRLGSSQGIRKPDAGLCRVADERPTQAPAAASAQAYAYAPAAANGAGAEAGWAAGFTARHLAAVTTQHHAMRAFRGLEPWRDPS